MNEPFRTRPRVTSPEEQAQAVEALRGFVRPAGRQDPKAWAHRLRFRELSGERLSRYQRDAWREALHSGAKPDTAYESTT